MSANDLLQLQQPLKDGGIRSVNFFNGRLLTGKDLSREQAARREADARVGLALGDGVAFGLEVARDAQADQTLGPVLRIKAGLAVNRAGQTLRLTADASVMLARRFDVSASGCVFGDCTPISGGTYVAGAGVYLLTIAPAELSEGKAASNGLDSANVACNTDALIEAVQFRLLSVNPLRYAGLDTASSQFRNRIAYRCFGVEALEQSMADPWRVEPARYGLIDELRDAGLDDRDVPLALVYWTAQGLQFVDIWAVRRPLSAPDAFSGLALQASAPPNDMVSAFAFIARRRRAAEAYAMCAQFQAHSSDLLAAAASPGTLSAGNTFRYLPPFGIVPLQSAPLRGFSIDAFFDGIVRRSVPVTGQQAPYIDARLLGALQDQALAHAPIDLMQNEFVWVYRPWQNAKAALDGQSVQRIAVFASGQLPDLALPRLDMARFDFSNVAACCSES